MAVLPFPKRTDPATSEHRASTLCEKCGVPAVRAVFRLPDGVVGMHCRVCGHEWRMPERRISRRHPPGA